MVMVRPAPGLSVKVSTTPSLKLTWICSSSVWTISQTRKVLSPLLVVDRLYRGLSKEFQTVSLRLSAGLYLMGSLLKNTLERSKERASKTPSGVYWDLSNLSQRKFEKLDSDQQILGQGQKFSHLNYSRICKSL